MYGKFSFQNHSVQNIWIVDKDCGLSMAQIRQSTLIITKASLQESTTPTAAGTSAKTPLHFIQSYYACKMRSYYPGIKLLSLDWRQQYVKSRPPCNFKTGPLKSLVGIKKRPQNTNHKLSDNEVRNKDTS